MNLAEELNIYATSSHTLDGSILNMYSLTELWKIAGAQSDDSPNIWLYSDGEIVITRLLLSLKTENRDLYRIVECEHDDEVYAVLPLMLDYAEWLDPGIGMVLKEIIDKIH